MYPLGKQFEVDVEKGKCIDKVVFSSKCYRISVLSERLVRLEYNPSGHFVDAPSQMVSNRVFSLPKMKVNETNKILEITTSYFHLTYIKNAPFLGSKLDPMKNLKITLITGKEEDNRAWYYQHPEVRNMNGNCISDDLKTPDFLKRGLYSLEGFASFDDSQTLLYASDGTVFAREKGSIDVYVFMYYRDFSLAMQDYFLLTGKPKLLPRYAFGNWWSRDTSYTTDSLFSLVQQFSKRNIPLSIILLDHDWHYRDFEENHHLESGFTFNSKLFTDSTNLAQRLHEYNIRLGLTINPEQGIYPYEMYYQKACEYLNIQQNKIIVFDPLNPKLLDVYFKLFLHPLETMGVDFFFHDYKNISFLTSFLAYQHYHFQDANRDPKKRALMLARNPLYAPHRYSVLYAGVSSVSWQQLKEIVDHNLNASNIGISWWSHDVGGYHGGIEESELYVRSVELGVFSPILRFHAARGTYYKREPWRWDIKTELIVNDYLRLRHRLIPYLYTESYFYYQNAKPLIEPFYYQNPFVIDDDVYRYQYYFGRELLVCPILGKKDVIMNRTIQSFYIPDGTWYDFKTGKKFPGHKKYVSFYKEEDYPVFAKSGAIIPLSNRSDMNNVGLPLDLEIHIFPGTSNLYTLYEDDGISELYEEGYYLKTDIDYNYLQNNYTVIIRSVEGKSGIVPECRNYKIRFRNTKQADEVKAYFNDMEIKVDAMYIEDNDFIVEIKQIDTIGQLTIYCKGKDIEIDAVRLINEDIDSILMDLQIETDLKEKIAAVIFGDEEIKKKRIAIRKLRYQGLSKAYMTLFLKLLEYIEQV